MTGGQAIQFKGEMIGGAGSLCPALVSNPALRKLRSRIFTEFFNNGDGLLVTGPVGEEDPHDIEVLPATFDRQRSLHLAHG